MQRSELGFIMPKVYVHIGLPKTATTSLQVDFFPFLDKKECLYAGVIQPRTEPSHVLYSTFMKGINTGRKYEEIRTMIKEVLNEGKSVVISEECILVSNRTICWKQKLQNCAAILKDFDYRILVTVREPVSTIFSYYVERIDWFKQKKRSFDELVQTDEDMKIFHARYFFSILFERVEEKRVFVVKFEDMISGNLSKLIEFLNGVKISTAHKGLRRTNSKRKFGGRIYSGKKRKLINIIKNLVRKFRIDQLSGYSRFKVILRPVTRQLRRIAWGEFVVDEPSPNEIKSLQVQLRNETNALNELFGIKY
jgi:hypothetical protein